MLSALTWKILWIDTGDTPETAIVVGDLPASFQGDTRDGFSSVFNGLVAGAGPDVFYSFTPAMVGALD